MHPGRRLEQPTSTGDVASSSSRSRRLAAPADPRSRAPLLVEVDRLPAPGRPAPRDRDRVETIDLGPALARPGSRVVARRPWRVSTPSFPTAFDLEATPQIDLAVIEALLARDARLGAPLSPGVAPSAGPTRRDEVEPFFVDVAPDAPRPLPQEEHPPPPSEEREGRTRRSHRLGLRGGLLLVVAAFAAGALSDRELARRGVGADEVRAGFAWAWSETAGLVARLAAVARAAPAEAPSPASDEAAGPRSAEGAAPAPSGGADSLQLLVQEPPDAADEGARRQGRSSISVRRTLSE